MIRGESFTVALTFNSGYDITRIDEMTLSIGNYNLCSLSAGSIINTSGQIFHAYITGETTAVLSLGERPMVLALKDSTDGTRKAVIALISIQDSGNTYDNPVDGETANLVISLVYNATNITPTLIIADIYAGAGIPVGGTIGQYLKKSSATNYAVEWTSDIDLKESIVNVDSKDALKADKTTQVIAGDGLTGGGDLSSNKTISIVSSTDGITVNADNIALETVDTLISTSSTKPLSANQGKQLQDTKQNISEKGQANGYASLGLDGKVPALQLPSYVDDLIEGYYRVSNGLFYQEIGYINLIAGETGKIYVSLDTNKTYRWGGSSFVYITSGAVDSVAGKTGVVTLIKSDVGLSNVDNTSDANKPISSATQTALNAKVATTGNETITGIKTFASSPIVPNPTTAMQAANKDYIDTINTSLYVENIDGGVARTIYGGVTGIDGGTAQTIF